MNRDDELIIEAYYSSQVDRLLESIFPEYRSWVIEQRILREAEWDSTSTIPQNLTNYNPDTGVSTYVPDMIPSSPGIGPVDLLKNSWEWLVSKVSSGADLIADGEALMTAMETVRQTLWSSLPHTLIATLVAKLLGKGIKFLLRNYSPEAKETRKKNDREIQIAHAMQEGEKMTEQQVSEKIEDIGHMLDKKYGSGSEWWKTMLWKVADFLDTGAGKYIAGLSVLIYLVFEPMSGVIASTDDVMNSIKSLSS